MLIAYLLGRASGARKARRDAERERLLGAMAERQRLRAPEPEPVLEGEGMGPVDWAIVIGAAILLLVLGVLLTWWIVIIAVALVIAYFWTMIFG